MKVDKSEFRYDFSFERDDWTNGLARIMMDAIKALPREERNYSGYTKKWSVSNNDSNKKVLNKVYADWEKTQATDMQLDLYDDSWFLKQFD